MRKVFIIAAFVAALLLSGGTGYLVGSLNAENVIVEVPADPEMAEEPTGGLETPVEAPEPTDVRYLFPIHATDYRYTSPKGVRVSPTLKVKMEHNGLDISSVWRAQVVAIADGLVREHWPVPGTPYPTGGTYDGHPVYGGMIILEHDDGSKSLYAHLSATYVHEGFRVKAGQIIGRIGNTGISTGEHLHFELEVSGESVNPLHYIEQPVKGE